MARTRRGRDLHEVGDAWARAGFTEQVRIFHAPLELIERLLAGAKEPSFGMSRPTTSRQFRAVRQYVPRLPAIGRQCRPAQRLDGRLRRAQTGSPRCSAGSRASCHRMGAVLIPRVEKAPPSASSSSKRGRVMDEYLSVPEIHGPLPPGDVIGLGANPTVVARLTHADPARVRRVARTAVSANELPPAPELIEQIADVLGVEGAGYGYSGAAQPKRHHGGPMT